MAKLPETLRKVTDEFAPAFTKPTHARWGVLVAAAILTVGSRTMMNVLRTVGRLAPGHASSYHRVLSRARFAQRRRARLTLVSRFYPDANLFAAPPKPRGKKNGRPPTHERHGKNVQ